MNQTADHLWPLPVVFYTTSFLLLVTFVWFLLNCLWLVAQWKTESGLFFQILFPSRMATERCSGIRNRADYQVLAHSLNSCCIVGDIHCNLSRGPCQISRRHPPGYQTKTVQTCRFSQIVKYSNCTFIFNFSKSNMIYSVNHRQA